MSQEMPQQPGNRTSAKARASEIHRADISVTYVDLPALQKESVADGIRLLATWLLRHHRKMVRMPKDRSK